MTSTDEFEYTFDNQADIINKFTEELGLTEYGMYVMDYGALTLDELSYFTPEQKQQVGKRVQKYFETMPHQMSLTKFVVGKYNFDMEENHTVFVAQW